MIFIDITTLLDTPFHLFYVLPKNYTFQLNFSKLIEPVKMRRGKNIHSHECVRLHEISVLSTKNIQKKVSILFFPTK